MQDPKTCIFVGRSGAGKGTQAKLLLEYLAKTDKDRESIYIETGARFREFMRRENNHTASLVREMLDKGGLLPEFLPIWMWSDCFIETYTGAEHLILDGLARRISEAPILDSALQFYNRKNPIFFHVNVSDDWAVKRLLERGREDDNERDIRERLSWFEINVVPVIEFFKNNPYYTFVDVNGEQSIEDVHKEILSHITEA